MTALPSVKQMVNRASEGHYKALKAFRDTTALVSTTTPDSAVRGYMSALRTLRAWECINGDQLTDRGRELIAAYEEKWGLRACTCGGSDYASCLCNLSPREWLAYAKTNPNVDQGLTLPKGLQ